MTRLRKLMLDELQRRNYAQNAVRFSRGIGLRRYNRPPAREVIPGTKFGPYQLDSEGG